MGGIIKNLVSFILNILKIPVYILGVFAVCFATACIIYRIYFFIKGIHRKHSKEVVYVPQKHRLLFARLFFDLPQRFILDMLQKEPGFFPYQGCIIFCGRQGAGKTIALVEFMRRMQREYPKAKVITNLAYKYEDDVLQDWHPLVSYKNGIYGVIACIDEMQNWFSSNQSKDFPPEMLQVITQNRKNRRIILGTSQVFTRLSKPLREQASEVRECKTLLGCITFVFRKEPILSAEGDVTEYKSRGFYFFVHDKDLRDSYDTYKVIDSLAESGFQPRIVEPDPRLIRVVVNK